MSNNKAFTLNESLTSKRLVQVLEKRAHVTESSARRSVMRGTQERPIRVQWEGARQKSSTLFRFSPAATLQRGWFMTPSDGHRIPTHVCVVKKKRKRTIQTPALPAPHQPSPTCTPSKPQRCLPCSPEFDPEILFHAQRLLQRRLVLCWTRSGQGNILRC